MPPQVAVRNMPSTCEVVVFAPRTGNFHITPYLKMPENASILATGSTIGELQDENPDFRKANVLIIVYGDMTYLPTLINALPHLEWIHAASSGVDHIMCPEIVDNDNIVLTNSKGVLSSPLAEYVITACNYFAKDLRRVMQNQVAHKWEKFPISELRGKTMGIVGYGSIGSACAKLAHAFGMRVLGMRRNPAASAGDPYVTQMYGNGDLKTVMEQSDYLVLCLASTTETQHLIGADEMQHAKRGMVLINIGRGSLVDEAALIDALGSGQLTGAALDVFEVEPLEGTSPLWDLPNVFVTSHNMCITKELWHTMAQLFAENIDRFLRGNSLECVVDKQAGY